MKYTGKNDKYGNKIFSNNIINASFPLDCSINIDLLNAKIYWDDKELAYFAKDERNYEELNFLENIEIIK